MPKPLTVWITTSWKILSERDGNTKLLTCLLRNLYVSQEAPVRIEHGITDWLKIGKGVHQGYTSSPCLFNFYAESVCAKSFHSRLTLCGSMDCNLPGSSVHRILQARILAIPSSRGSSWPRDQTCISCVSCIGRRILYHWATREAILCRVRHAKYQAGEIQAEIKIARRNINNLRYADDTTLITEISGKDPFDEGERVERKADLKLSIQKN